MKKSFFGPKYYADGIRINLNKAGEILFADAAAYQSFVAAKNNELLATVSGIPGGFLVGYEIGRVLNDEKLNTERLIIGGGLLLLSTIFQIKSLQQYKDAVLKFNPKVGFQEKDRKMQINLGLVRQDRFGLTNW